jgi:RecB family endonuclease NucS
VRLVVADCSVDYTGRLSAHLPPARRLLVVKADGTVIVHGDRGHKALNWMSPPCTILERTEGWTVTGSKGERLEISINAIHLDTSVDLGSEPGLRKTGSETDLQWLLAQSPDAIAPGLRLVAREFPTDLGPVDLLLRDADGATIAVEVKRVGELAAVEQLSRYLERLNRDASLSPVRGLLVAQTIKPQTRVLAEARGIGCVEVDFDRLAGRVVRDPTLF